MNSDTRHPHWLLMGTTGRVGGLVSKSWAKAPPKAHISRQARDGSQALNWDAHRDGSDPLLHHIAQNGPIDAIVALIGCGSFGTNEEFRSSIEAMTGVVRAAVDAGIPRVLLASSSAVYGYGEDHSETIVPKPVSHYGRAKQTMEETVMAIPRSETEICCMRIGNVAGADALLVQAEGNAPDTPIMIDRFPDGAGPIRSYIAPSMLATCIGALLQHDDALPPYLNIAGTPPVDMAALAEAAGLTWLWQRAAPQHHPSQRITLDCARLADIVGHDAIETSEEAIVKDLEGFGSLL